MKAQFIGMPFKQGNSQVVVIPDNIYKTYEKQMKKKMLSFTVESV